jgi:hypothetical protein
LAGRNGFVVNVEVAHAVGNVIGAELQHGFRVGQGDVDGRTAIFAL